MRIGVDVGGTNTDAVALADRRVLATCKTPTTPEVGDGIIRAVESVLSESGRSAADVKVVMIGTTHFTNAFVQRKGLLPVGVLRAGLPATRALPPLSDWPADLARAVGGEVVMVEGGYQFDGEEISPLDERAVAEAARAFRRKGLEAVSISCVFSPVNHEMEERAGEIVRTEHPEARITLSSQIGRIGLLARENAGVMNASLAGLAERTIASFRRALAGLGIDAPFYVSQNDGTLMAADVVERYPVLTFASGPTNSMRGAAYLSGQEDAIVADIGGTTTDIGVLRQGFARESSIPVDIGGVRTNFRMPDVLALGLGGGSLVDPEDPSRIGPESVGYRIDSEALIFGGSTLTATDVAVAAGQARIGDAAGVANLAPDFVERAVARIHAMLEEGVDRMKASGEPEPLILVGGGAVLVGRELRGVSDVRIPGHAAVANAIGASIAQVGGEVDRVFAYEKIGRERALEQAREEAIASAVDAGALPDTVTVTDVEEVPMAYVPGGSVRLRVKAAGELGI